MVQIDAIHVTEHLVLVASIGINGEGVKRPLGLIEGTSHPRPVRQGIGAAPGGPGAGSASSDLHRCHSAPTTCTIGTALISFATNRGMMWAEEAGKPSA